MTYYSTAAQRAVNSMQNFELVKMLQQDLDGEVGAIEQYEEHLKHIRDPAIADRLREIINDERDHYNILSKIIKEVTT